MSRMRRASAGPRRAEGRASTHKRRRKASGTGVADDQWMDVDASSVEGGREVEKRRLDATSSLGPPFSTSARLHPLLPCFSSSLLLLLCRHLAYFDLDNPLLKIPRPPSPSASLRPICSRVAAYHGSIFNRRSCGRPCIWASSAHLATVRASIHMPWLPPLSSPLCSLKLVFQALRPNTI